MLKLDTATFLATQENPAGPITRLESDELGSAGPVTDAEGNVSKLNAAAFLAAYALLSAFVACLLFGL